MNRTVAYALLRTEFQTITGLAIDDWHADGPRVMIRVGSVWFAVEYTAAATTQQIGTALCKLQTPPVTAPDSGLAVSLLVVPYMSSAGRQLCRAAGASWLDLSGNAEIVAAGLYLRILGEPNRYKRPGQPETMFASRSARAARTLLMDPARIWSQTELAASTGLSAGYLSRLLPRYEEAGFLRCDQDGRRFRYQVTDPDALIDAWSADYRFDHHTILRGHVAARSGPELLRDLAASLASRHVDYAATGLASAWLWEPFAAFRMVTLYLPVRPTGEMLAEIGFHEGARGSNTWLVVPDDEGVFVGAAESAGIRCVSAVQTYLDLKDQPERAEEARVELRRVHLTWPNMGQERQP